MSTVELIGLINTAIILAGLAGCLFAFLRAGKTEVKGILKETVDALQAQITAIKDKLEALEKDNTRLRQIIEMIQEALSKRGIHITIDGDLVTVTENNVTSLHKRTRTKTAATEAKKTDE